MPYVLSQTFAVQPWFSTVIVADVEDVEDIREITTVKSLDDKDIGLRVKGDGYGVVEYGRGCVGMSVYRIYTHHVGRTDHFFHIFYIGHGIVAHDHSRIR